MKMLNRIIKKSDNDTFIIDYYYTDFFLRVFSIFWIFYIIYVYQEISSRPENLYEPIIWFQKWLMHKLPSPYIFYLIVTISIGLCLHTIKNKKIIYRVILFLLLIWLNALKWNYNFFSHVGHLFLLAHFLTLIIPSKHYNDFISSKEKNNFSLTIRWAIAGVLVTYTMAGIWKFSTLFYKIFAHSNKVNWMSEDAVELNAIVSSRIWDETISDFMLLSYEIPFVWQFATIFIFLVQLIAVLGAFNKKITTYVLIFLLVFHIYNMLFINTFFYVSSFVLIIFLFPYHKLPYLKYHIKL